ncbi:RDD [Cinara cedri]|uniref:RDD n=1 Tax=Cinara cedri TaxID=506608 RepID=A0A5E4NC41_9HEMI|nr:RDD [Cinara cedri]
MDNPADKSAKNNDTLNKPIKTSKKPPFTKPTSKKPMPTEDGKSNKEIRENYFKQLRSWMNTVNSYQCYYNKLQEDLVPKKTKQVPKSPIEVPNPPIPVPNVPETPNVTSTQFVGIRCQVPSLWKRFGAEFIDFVLLSLLKFVVAYFVVESFMDIDFTKYNTFFMQEDLDYTAAVEMTSEIFFLEISHRIVVCVYEVYWLQGTVIIQGGATLGKILLDLTVVRTDKLYNIQGQPNNIIALTPGGDLGWKRAILRSVTKNLFFSFMFPLPFIAAAANQNRCAYDVLSGSMVVEFAQPFRCEQSELIPIV